LKKKRRVNTFKNWLLARDSASRISTFPKYHSFLESYNHSKRSMYGTMALLQKIKNNKPFFKLERLISYEAYQLGDDGVLDIRFEKRDLKYSILVFLESFDIVDEFMSVYLKVKLNDSIDQSQIIDRTIVEDKTFRELEIDIPSSLEDSEIVLEAESILRTWIEGINYSQDSLNNFFKWWMTNFLFVEDMYGNFLKSFESAFVEWMRQAPIHLVEQAYSLLLFHSKNDKIIRKNTSPSNEDVVSHVNQGIEEFGINIPELKKVTDLLSKFGL